ncbi:MAG: trypsin-like peptidase domain-containing protein [Oscillospiraceae bacterium]|nr:trypsin-like peptidase domain-containing protein [Oscillospiraceae bacterium]
MNDETSTETRENTRYIYAADGVYHSIPSAQPQPQAEAAKPTKQKNLTGKIIALALCCSLLGGAAGAGGVMLISSLSKQQPEIVEPAQLPENAAEKEEETASLVYEGQREAAIIENVKVSTGKLLTPAQVYAASVNSTVGITTQMVSTNYWGYTTNSAASGSGFIFTDDGYIITNYHVIEDSSTVTVTTYDGTAYNAAVIGFSEENDVAVLKVDAKGLTPVVLGNSDLMNVGDDVVAIGNPLGELTFTLTAGAVSALNREITLSSGVTMNLIQTDCAINSGNSGGALFNLYGEVIGITNAKYASSSSGASIDNIGFAIPMNSVRELIEEIIRTGYTTKAYIGVQVTNVSDQALSFGVPAGAVIAAVTENSPAMEAGLKENDIITAANGTEITSSSDLVQFVGSCAIGDKIELTVYRERETITLQLVVGEQIQSVSTASSSNANQQQSGMGSFFGSPFGGFGYGGRG